MKTSVLIVEDHTSLFEYYEQVLNSLYPEQVELVHAKTKGDAIENLKRHFDFAVVDVLLESTRDENTSTGKDIALHLRQSNPETKILLSTTITHTHLIHDLMTSIAPEGFIIKSDFDNAECQLAFKTVIEGGKHFSQRVRRYQKSLQVFDKKTSLSMEDYQILLLMNSNYSTNMIARFIHKSPRSVEYTKTRIKDILGLDHNSEIVPYTIEAGIL